MRNWLLFIGIFGLIGFLVWFNWPKKQKINPDWLADYGAAVNAGYSVADATAMADKNNPKFVTN